jgi:hypothetical protein
MESSYEVNLFHWITVKKMVHCELCTTHVTYGYPGQRGTRCAAHQEPGMIDVVSRKCQCGKYPSYGFPDGVTICCKDCKLDGMIVKKKARPCEVCEKQSSFGFPNESRIGGKPVRCTEHKIEGMLNFVNVLCFCGVRACYGYEVDKPIVCATHKTDEMTESSAKKCDMCRTLASFGWPNTGSRIRCAKHVDEGMIYLSGVKCELCDTQASFGILGGKATRCMEHRDVTMVNVRNKLCIICNFICAHMKAPGSRTAEYCAHCFYHEFPESKPAGRYLCKQSFVMYTP